MKTTITLLVGLLVGVGVGWYFGYTRPIAKANRDAHQRMLAMDADNSMAAAVAYRTFILYDAGETQKAMQALAWPIGLYYRANKQQPLTEDRSNFLAEIEQLAKTNRVVATEIRRDP